MPIPSLFWSAIVVAAVAVISALVLSIQRAISHSKASIEYGQIFKSDKRRDESQFSDDERQKRLVPGTIILTALAVYQLILSVQDFKNTAEEPNPFLFNVLAAIFQLVSWLYALSLTIMCSRYRLPDTWGWVLNVHLCIFYLAAFGDAAYKVVSAIYSMSEQPLSYSLYLFAWLFISWDLLFVTGTTPRGAPFVDEEGKPVSPVTVSSCFGFIFFSWVSPLISMTYNRNQLELDDLPILPATYRGRNLFYAFKKNRGERLFPRLVKANVAGLTVQVSTAMIGAALFYAPPFAMNQLLVLITDIKNDHAEHDSSRVSQGYYYVFLLFILSLLIGLTTAQTWYWGASSIQVRTKAMVNIEIYAKTLRRREIASATGEDLASSGEGEDAKQDDKKEDDKKEDVSSSTGTIVNLMSTDSNRISEFFTWWFTFLEAPVELAIGIYFLYVLLGVSSLLGLMVMVITLPLNHFNAKVFSATQDKLMETRDKRIALMNEILQGVRQIKFFAWEKNWEEKILARRNMELKQLKTTFLLEVGFNLLWQGSPLLVTIISFWSYTKLQGNELTAATAFTAIAVFAELRFALNVLPECFIECLQFFISIKRVQTYLDEPEVEQPPPIDVSQPAQVGLSNATITWPSNNVESVSDAQNGAGSSASSTTAKNSEGFILKDVSIDFPNGKLSIICGSTGAGKTLLMLSLLGETTVLNGQVFCPRQPIADDVDEAGNGDIEIPDEDWILEHSVAFVSQTAWLQNASIRDNIIFGLPFNKKRYFAVLKACALEKDLSVLEDGDETEIGEKGITLSGGQKARVALARAVYSRAKNVFMDDVLSAVDAHTARHLYDNCLTGPLMRTRTRVLITHYVRLCATGASQLIFIKGGVIQLSGDPAHLRQTGELNQVFEEEEKDHKEEALGETSAAATETVEEIVDEEVDENADLNKKKPKALVEEETRATGMVKLRLYSLYFSSAGSIFYWLGVFFAFIFLRGLVIGEAWWVKEWTQSYAAEQLPDGNVSDAVSALNMSPFGFHDLSNSARAFAYSTQDMAYNTFSRLAQPQHSLDYYLGIYILITSLQIVFSGLRFGLVYWGSLRASKVLYVELLRRVFRAPLRFFDTTPVGRILNRFSKDFETIDSSIPNDFAWFLQQSLTALSIVMLISYYLPVFALPMLAISVVYILIGKLFVNASREFKRMESVTRSPIFTHFTETIVGATTIRAFGNSKQFLQRMVKLSDINSRPYNNVWVVNRWVSVRFNVLGSIINAMTALVIILNLDYVDASLAGLCLSFTLNFTDQMFWAVRRYTSLELSFNAVERIVEFMEMDQEAPAIVEPRPPASWPHEGQIEVKDLQIRYAADLDPVLHGISFNINPREKIGVVGRTGSGKSTLALSFFRFVEASQGSISIDGIDISKIGTEDLRSNLTIIPQDPTLFSGTLRSNLDPFDQFEDREIFESLRRVHLLPASDDEEALQDEESNLNANVFRNLDSPVSEGGKNFSQGQRQLLCLARALLKRCRIVFMDEATASVDFKTDEAIQHTIATEFADCTILCIAHRLLTVVEYDRILVLDHGKIEEFASPYELITDPNSAFYKMCKNSGEFDKLVALAKKKHQLVDV
ncbi:hypothetical protein K450DRAFT_302879 [Umbelopsis ramanniana AG]|uniref:P-loop containing nucleoside triphosphate hydrolase protein n=1 Tax=Umbelopsis ramanniana AG TaxID=1314678 RepID=A0AAD5E4I3_UMBRA|nr:uncharacterized protein K450DRAFT_302879 [Umbelopsis ramanniana AG]KAI8576230.1 hypothetical protein K450DRAFT_302879 [Umbelopsis ramanniana AG]